MDNEPLIKLVEQLKTKIRKIEHNHKKNIKSPLSKLSVYRISSPKINSKNSKKLIGLLFDNNHDDIESIDSTNDKNKLPFIKINKNNNVINYTLTLKFNVLKDAILTLSLGIRDNKNSKIKIIKGSKMQYDIKKACIDNTLIVNNTLIYNAPENQELCLIATIDETCMIESRKSMIKILNI